MGIDVGGAEVCHVAEDDDAGVADEHLQVVPSGLDAVAEFGGARCVRQIAGDRNRAVSDGGCGPVRQFLGAVHGYDPVAAPGEAAGDLGADPRGGAGDECGASGHGSLPSDLCGLAAESRPSLPRTFFRNLRYVSRST